MPDQPVRVLRDGPLASLVLDAPPLNLFDRSMVDGLTRALTVLEADPPRALLVRAEGRVVSGGLDVRVIDGLTPEAGAELWRELLAITRRVEDLPYPTIFAAHALCMTAAFELSLACDVLLAAESVRFGLVEIVVGLAPSMGGPQRLAERAGPARAREVVYSGELFAATTLERWNVVNRVYPDAGFSDQAEAFARRIANGPTLAHRATKRIIREQLDAGTRAADDAVVDASSPLFETEDTIHGIASFLDAGPGHARFMGR